MLGSSPGGAREARTRHRHGARGQQNWPRGIGREIYQVNEHRCGKRHHRCRPDHFPNQKPKNSVHGFSTVTWLFTPRGQHQKSQKQWRGVGGFRGKHCNGCIGIVEKKMRCGGLVAINFIFPYILGMSNHPNRRTHIFQRGGYTTTNQLMYEILRFVSGSYVVFICGKKQSGWYVWCMVHIFMV